MLTKEEMFEIATSYLSRSESGIELVIVEEHSIVKDYGIIFFYNSKEYLETGNFSSKLIGNAPFLVEKEGGRICVFGTAFMPDIFIEDYESGKMEYVRYVDEQ